MKFVKTNDGTFIAVETIASFKKTNQDKTGDLYLDIVTKRGEKHVICLNHSEFIQLIKGI